MKQILFCFIQNNGPVPLEYSMDILPQEVPIETVLFVKPIMLIHLTAKSGSCQIQPGSQEVIIKVYLMPGSR